MQTTCINCKHFQCPDGNDTGLCYEPHRLLGRKRARSVREADTCAYYTTRYVEPPRSVKRLARVLVTQCAYQLRGIALEQLEDDPAVVRAVVATRNALDHLLGLLPPEESTTVATTDTTGRADPPTASPVGRPAPSQGAVSAPSGGAGAEPPTCPIVRCGDCGAFRVDQGVCLRGHEGPGLDGLCVDYGETP